MLVLPPMKGYNYHHPAAWIYRPNFYRHLHHLTISGFYTRELDADDFEFLEQVKTRGIANGTLPCTNTVLLEELEYWHLPYAIDWTIKRTHGPVPTRGKGETPESKAIRIAAWKARNAERLANKAISEAEMEREQAEWEAARARRKWREINVDAEWEAADPARKAKSASGSVSGKRKLIRYAGSTANPRYYVPEWKREEERAEKARKQAQQDASDAERNAIAAEKRAERAAAARAEAEEQLAAVKADRSGRDRVEAIRAAKLQANLDRIARREGFNEDGYHRRSRGHQEGDRHHDPHDLSGGVDARRANARARARAREGQSRGVLRRSHGQGRATRHRQEEGAGIMEKRVTSEVRRPGMTGTRRCCECGVELARIISSAASIAVHV